MTAACSRSLWRHWIAAGSHDLEAFLAPQPLRTLLPWRYSYAGRCLPRAGAPGRQAAIRHMLGTACLSGRFIRPDRRTRSKSGSEAISAPWIGGSVWRAAALTMVVADLRLREHSLTMRVLVYAGHQSAGDGDVWKIFSCRPCRVRACGHGLGRQRPGCRARRFEDRHGGCAARQHGDPAARGQRASRPSTSSSSDPPRSSGARSSPARSTFIRNTPATARSSFPSIPTLPGKMARPPMRR